MANLSADKARWSARLIKQGKYKFERMSGHKFARLVLRNLLADKKVKLSHKAVKAVIK